MAYLKDFQNDLFVSFAKNDNAPPVDEKNGWITNLVSDLLNEVPKHLKEYEAISISYNTNIQSGVDYNQQLVRDIENSALALVIISHEYFKSPWALEKNSKLVSLLEEKVISSSRLFLVEIEDVNRETWFPGFQSVLSYKFWEKNKEDQTPKTFGYPKPDPKDSRYYEVATDLIIDLSNSLDGLRKGE